MKKSLLAVAIAATFVLAACGQEAKAEATVFGSVEQRIEMSGGTSNIDGDDNYIGVKLKEDLGNGMSAIGIISFDLNTEANSTATVKDQYVGLTDGTTTITAGRVKNFIKQNGVTDIFEGTTFRPAAQKRVDSSVQATTSVSGVKVGLGAHADDTANTQDGVDTYEAMVGLDLGSVSVTASYEKNQTTLVENKMIGAKASVAGATVGATYELDNNDVATTTITAKTVMGSNTLKGGYETIENGTNTYIAELQHNFTKNTSAYINYSDNDAANSDATTMIGMRMKF